ncbi:MAG TPA: non-homologous end-joining DNA ligase, partial [Nannocystaceae bacterium]|nr:non-homologous end-joining DNA ligase [Nannocystaceae bacterium]
MVTITHGDRVVYPADGWTKADVVAHYGRVAAAMLPHVANRPLTLVRHRTNIDDKGFFQKNSPKHFPELIARIEVPKSDGVNQHASVTNREGLEYLANQGAVELHVALAAAPHLDRPDRLVIDLDPLSADPAHVRTAARRVRTLFEQLELESTPVASGGKGYHVYVALVPTADSHDIARCALILANALAHRFPDELTIETLKKNREGRVYVDWLRNTFSATVIAPYSLRARARAPVAVPIRWDELDDVAPGSITIATVAERLERADPLLELAKTPVDGAVLCARCEALREELALELVRYDRFVRPVP